jgi:hypothetical protein
MSEEMKEEKDKPAVQVFLIQITVLWNNHLIHF